MCVLKMRLTFQLLQTFECSFQMFQIWVIFAPGLKILPRHVSPDNLATTTQRKMEATLGQERLELGVGHSDSRFDDPTSHDFGNSSVSRKENVVVSVFRIFDGIWFFRKNVVFGFNNLQIVLDMFENWNETGKKWRTLASIKKIWTRR